MYQVITMFGDNEPWWFFEDWEEDIEAEETFESFEEARQAASSAKRCLRSSHCDRCRKRRGTCCSLDLRVCAFQ